MPTADPIAVRSVRSSELFVVDTLYHRRDSMRAWRSEIALFDNFVRGEWSVTFPNGRTVIDTPKIENRARGMVEDVGRLAGNVLPTIRIEPLSDGDYVDAEKRERVLRFFWQKGFMVVTIKQLFMDLLATGLCAVSCWPDMSQPPEKRFPLIRRIDPRTIWPPIGHVPGSPPEDVLIEQVVKLRTLVRQYPEQAAALEAFLEAKAAGRRGRRQKVDASSADVLLIDYWTPEQIQRVAVVPGERESAIFLENTPNSLGRVPVVLGVLPTADGSLRGHVTHMLPLLSAENRLMSYVLDYADQMVFAPLTKRGDVANAEDFGPGATIDLGQEGEIGRVPPAAANPQVFGVISDLERQGRASGTWPAARQGDISQSIGSAAFVESLMGPLSTIVRTMQDAMEVFLPDVNEVCAEVDKAYCNTQKTILGVGRGGTFRDRYTPSRLWTDTSNLVVYGLAGGGTDAFNRDVRIIQRVQSGLGSITWGMENLEGYDSVAKEWQRIVRERNLQALLAGIQQQVLAGNVQPMLIWEQAIKEGEFLLDPQVLVRVASAFVPTEPAGGGAAGGGGEAIAASRSAESDQQALEKGGIPAASSSGGGGRPALSQLLANRR